MNLPDDYAEKHLLVVDDEPEITRALYRQFRKKYIVHTANSASEAESTLKEYDVQVIISDQRMPVTTGVEFLANVRKEYPETTRIILTGYADIEAVINAINDGNIYRYVGKPWTPSQLDHVVDEAFRNSFLIYQNKLLVSMLTDYNQKLEEKVSERTSELSALNVKLTALNQEKNKFLGIAAHDLRNPIGAIYNMADLCDHFIAHEKYDSLTSYMVNIRQASQFSLSLLNDLLDYSKIESGKLDLHIQLADYQSLISENLHYNKALAQPKGLSIDLSFAACNCQFCFDGLKILQVINNLVGNAIKFSPPNTSICIKVSQTAGYVLTEVSDQGPGLKEADFEKLFRPFQTGSAQSTQGEKKTGLGLAISKKVVEGHQGQIGVRNGLGGGAVFYFTLPTGLATNI